MLEAYSRCVKPHYFRLAVCPFDGWSTAQSGQLAQTAARLRSSGKQPSLEALREAGASPQVLTATTVFEFGEAAPAIDALEFSRVRYDDPYGDWPEDSRASAATALLRGIGVGISRGYCLCSDGHFSFGRYCGEDGSTSRAQEELNDALDRALSEWGIVTFNEKLSIGVLRDLGVSEATLARALVAQFGAESSVFSTLIPRLCIVNGEEKPWSASAYPPLRSR